MKNLGKTVSVFLKVEELDKLELLRLNDVKFIDIVRRGIKEYGKELLTQGNIS
jgi:hypothetical protein